MGALRNGITRWDACRPTDPVVYAEAGGDRIAGKRKREHEIEDRWDLGQASRHAGASTSRHFRASASSPSAKNAPAATTRPTRRVSARSVSVPPDRRAMRRPLRRATRYTRVRSRSRAHAGGTDSPSRTSAIRAADVPAVTVQRATANGSSRSWESAFLTAAAERYPASITLATPRSKAPCG